MAMIARTIAFLLLALTAISNARGDAEDLFEPSAEKNNLIIRAASAFPEIELDSSSTVSVVKRADWEARGARLIPDALQQVPGVILLSAPGGTTMDVLRSYRTFSIRGQATMVDGVPINSYVYGVFAYSNPELQLPVLDRIEFVRGPSSILYGSDALSSAVVLSTYSNLTPGLSISGGFGDYGYSHIATRGTEIINNSQSIQFAAALTDQRDQHQPYHYPLDNTAASGTGYREKAYQAGTGMLRWENRGERANTELEIFHNAANAEGYPGAGTAFIDVLGQDTSTHFNQLTMFKAGVSGDITDAWDYSGVAYAWQNHFGQDNPIWIPSLGYETEAQTFIERRYGTLINLKNPNIEWLDSTTRLAISASVERQAIVNHHLQSILNNIPPFPNPDYDNVARNFEALSLEAKTTLPDKHWELIYGSRIDFYSSYANQTSPRAGIIWMPSEDLSFKALYGRSFRAPSVNEIYGTNFAVGSKDLKPENLDNYEFTMTKLLGPSTLNVVAFRNIWHDRIILIKSPNGPLGEWAALPKSGSQGIELGATLISGQTKLEIGATYLEDNINKASINECQCNNDVMPSWILNIGIGHAFLNPNINIFWSNYLHQKTRTGDDDVPGAVTDAPPYFRSDFRALYSVDKNLKFNLTVRNIFNRKNTIATIFNSNNGDSDIPRQLEVGYEYTF